MAEIHKLNLRDDMVEMVDYPEAVRQSVDEAAREWQEFCALPEDVKDEFAAEDHHVTVGYESKDGGGNNGDRKENFDFSFSPLGEEFLERVVERSGNDTATRFVAAIRKLQQQMIPMIEAFGERAENDYGVEGFADIAKHSAPNAFFRFLHYPAGAEVGEIIAQPHTDHSGFTFHLAETTEGCERLTPDGRWEALPVSEGQAAAFGSMQLQVASDNEIKAMAHRVIANEESARIGRHAIVCFVALHKMDEDGQVRPLKVYNREEHGRLQEKEPGFNYTMPIDEFRTLFS